MDNKYQDTTIKTVTELNEVEIQQVSGGIPTPDRMIYIFLENYPEAGEHFAERP